jgi:hypothetical protein
MAEFQYNNHVHSGTQQTPFLLDSGWYPHMGFEPRTTSRLETVNEFTEWMGSALSEAKSALAKAQEDMTCYYNQCREPAPEYAQSDRVYLDGSNIQTTRPYCTAAFSGDNSNTSSIGKGTVMNTTVGKMPQVYTPQHSSQNSTPPIWEPPIKSAGLSLTT